MNIDNRQKHLLCPAVTTRMLEDGDGNDDDDEDNGDGDDDSNVFDLPQMHDFTHAWQSHSVGFAAACICNLLASQKASSVPWECVRTIESGNTTYH